MSLAFPRTLRALSAEGRRHGAREVLGAAMLLFGWGAWFLVARVGVQATAAEARLESPVHRVDAPRGGVVRAAPVQVGEEVAEGALLVLLDDAEARAALAEARAREVSLGQALGAMLGEVEAQGGARAAATTAAGAGRAEAQARWAAAEAVATQSEGELARTLRMAEATVVAPAEVERAEARAQQDRAVAEAARLAWARQAAEQRARIDEQVARGSALQVELARLRAELEGVRGEIAAQELAVQRSRVTAPVAGRVAEAAALRAGAVVAAGDGVATIVAQEAPRAVAWFDPAEAVGRIAVGQPATMRLTGFSWTRYGVLEARVERVSSEPRDGRVRVELVVLAEGSAIPVQHGLEGDLEVEIERVSPASLVLRAAGGSLVGRP